MAEIRDKETNFQNAINTYQKALKVYTVENSPFDYAKAQTNLGYVYLRLAEIRDKKTNAQKAIDASQEALKAYAIEKYPIDYAKTQTNLECAEGLLL